MTDKKQQVVNPEALRALFEKKGIDAGDAALEETLKELDALVAEKIRVQKNKKRIVKNDSEKEQEKASEVLSKAQIEKLPKWVRDQLKDSVVIGSSKQVIQTPDGKKYHLGNTLNELPGGEWTFFLNSVINTRYPTSGLESYAHSIRKIHPSPKPPQLMRQIIEFFTKENEIVFDYFMGVGGTLLGASLCNRRALGIDLNRDYIKTYQEASDELGLTPQTAILGDSIKLLSKGESEIHKFLNGEKISLVLIDPPYGDMMSRPKTGEAAKKKLDSAPTPYTDSEDDLGNMDLESFFPIFNQSVESAAKLLKDKGHVVVFIKDLQPNGENTNLLHARMIEDLNKIEGLQYLGMKIWADQGVNLYPYGYPYSFVSNQIHQYILIFRKRDGK
jgi:16S rRNA G966 N2-methylase RsmD